VIRTEYKRNWRKENPDKVHAEHKRYYQAHREIFLRSSKRQALKRKEQWFSILKDIDFLRCSKCGYDRCIKAIEYHHPDNLVKTMEPARLLTYKPTPERIAEVKQCIPLCSNCHRELHDTESDHA
jgi:hypothetical protein